jgi:serine protease Do
MPSDRPWGEQPSPGQPAATPAAPRRLWLAAAAAAALLAAGAVGGAVGATIAQGRASALTPPVSLPGATRSTPSSFADVAAAVRPAVVSVQVQVRRPGMAARDFQEPFGEFFRRFAPRAQPPAESAGSGFFVTADGFIVTNNHVVENGERFAVTLDDGRTLDARLIGRDPRTDLAVLKVDGGDFTYVRFAADEPRIGDWVLAVGNPFGLGGTVTSGIVSARGRDIGSGPYDDFLQIDAPVNQGNSGGPAFNLASEVIGVNTAIYSPSGGNVGIAFAIPAATAKPIVEALRNNGSVARGYLGVSAQPVSEDIARSLGMSRARGALVAEVTAESPAARAGLAPGDIITRVNEREVADARSLARLVAAVEPGAEADITYLRDGRARTARVSLATQPDPQETLAASAGRPPYGARGDQAGNAALGLATAPTNEGLAVIAVDPSGAAAQRGLSVGDIIIEAGGQRVTEPADLDRAVAEARRVGRDVLLLRVQSREGAGYVAVPLSGAG